jgi:hypothetical protein
VSDQHALFAVDHDNEKHRVSRWLPWHDAVDMWYRYDDMRRAHMLPQTKYLAVRQVDDPDWPTFGPIETSYITPPPPKEAHLTATQFNILTTLFTNGAASYYGLIKLSQAKHFYTSPSGIRTRTNELIKRGLVHAVGREATPRKTATVWDLTPAGVDYVLATYAPKVAS